MHPPPLQMISETEILSLIRRIKSDTSTIGDKNDADLLQRRKQNDVMIRELEAIKQQIKIGGITDKQQGLYDKIVKFVNKTRAVLKSQSVVMRSPTSDAPQRVVKLQSPQDQVSERLIQESQARARAQLQQLERISKSPVWQTIPSAAKEPPASQVSDVEDTAQHVKQQTDDTAKVAKTTSSLAALLASSRPADSDAKQSLLTRKQLTARTVELQNVQEQLEEANERLVAVKQRLMDSEDLVGQLRQQLQKSEQQNVDLLNKQGDMLESIRQLQTQCKELHSHAQIAELNNQNATQLGPERAQQLTNLQNQILAKVARLTEMEAGRVTQLPRTVQQLALMATELKNEYLAKAATASYENDFIKRRIEQLTREIVEEEPVEPILDENYKPKLVREALVVEKVKSDPIGAAVIKAVKLLGTKTPQLRRIDTNKYVIERTGAVLTLAINAQDKVVVIDDSGCKVNKVPLGIHLKNAILGSSTGRVSRVKGDSVLKSKE